MSAFGFDPEEVFRRRRPRVVKDGGGPRRGRRWIWITLVIVLVVLGAARSLLSAYVDYLFFSSTGHTNVFWTPVTTQVWLFIVGFVLTGLVIGVSVPAWRAAAATVDERGRKYSFWIGIAVIVVAGIAGGSYFASNWQQVLLWMHGHNFGATDPVFGKDYGFFVFVLPVIDMVSAIGWAGALVGLLGAIGMAALCVSAENMPADLPFALRPAPGRTPGDGVRIAVRHAGLALVAVFIMAALGAHFTVYHLATSQHGNFWGLDATQRNIVRPVMGALQYVAVAFAALTAVFIALRWKKDSIVTSASFTGMFVFWLLINGVVQWAPAAIYQATSVTPNALSAQSAPITDFLNTSRYAWGLQDTSQVQTQQFPTPQTATLQDLASDPGTLNNVRIQDFRELPDALNQTDRSRSYQTYPTITVDRYPDQSGNDVEVMIGPREISSDNLPSSGFVPQSLIYTHGYGISAVSVNQAGESGKPLLIVGKQPMQQVASNAPPDLYFNGNAKADPRIYCGLSTNTPVVVNTTQKEFDYLDNNGSQHTSNAGYVQGIPVDSLLKKAALSLISFGGTDLFLTNSLTDQSEALLHRTIADRVSTLAPFLTVDSDPYVVVDPQTNHLMYIADAYVSTDQFPEAYQLSDGTSYKRNAVKAVVDAKTCQTTLYMVDPNEPLTATYNSIYPGLMQPLSSMPKYLVSHLRYPEDLFTNQSQVYASVHVDPKTPSVFFNSSDQWRVAQEVIGGNTQDTQPYYVELTLPGSSKASFVLLQTFSPASGGNGGQANNMTSWLAAESDYTKTSQPKLVSVRLPSNANVLGPLQFDNNINNDPTISPQISLLSQHGSTVILGNVIVLPFGNHSFLYVRPLYVAATNSGSASFPQLQRVIVGTQTNVAMGADFQSALQALFGTDQPIPGLNQPGSSPAPSSNTTPGATPVPTPLPTSNFPPAAIPIVDDLLKQQAIYQQDLAKGDFAGAGVAQEQIKKDSDQLIQLLGIPTPTP
jgi:uncharacterized protein